MKIYRIYPVGPIPSDLGERVSSIHASAILRSKSEDVPAKIQGSTGSNKKPGSGAVRRVEKSWD
jgi:hypothetical protein